LADSLASQGSPSNVATDPIRLSVIDRTADGTASLLPPALVVAGNFETPRESGFHRLVALSHWHVRGAVHRCAQGDDDWITVGRAAPTDQDQMLLWISVTSRRCRSMVAPAA
jgi:N-methylhydantoinase B/oxoprolinase/acetone carboxylase alpha subunit